MNLSTETKRAIQIAQALVHEHRHDAIAPPHLLLGLLHNDVGLASWLVALDKDVYFLRDWAEYRLELLPKATKNVSIPATDAPSSQAMQLAELIATQLESMLVEPVHVLAALLKANVAFSAEQLKSLPISQKEVLDAAQNENLAEKAVAALTGDGQAGAGTSAAPSAGGGAGESALEKFCENKTNLAREGKLDPIVGRDRELRLMLEILLRRTKPNVMLVGEPGVGKTALVDGFAQAIVAGTVPSGLQVAELYELDLGSLVAGASYKGEVEDRLKGILKEVKQHDKAVLFIDEIHMLLNPNGSVGAGVSQLLKPELARGDITVIGATTLDEYRQYVEKDEAFSRRFEQLPVHEPTTVAATRMVETLIPRYEEHHHMKTDEGVAGEAVRLAQRYVKDRRLPDAAVDLLDRTMAAIRTMGDTATQDLEALRTQLSAAREKVAALDDERQLAEYQWVLQQLQQKVSPILLQLVDENGDANRIAPEKIEVPEALYTYLTEHIEMLLPLAALPHETVSKQDVAAMVAAKTGIPMGKLQTNERERLLKMDEVLQKRVVGQDHAIHTLTASILESRAGLSGGKQPTGAFFLLGPTGTGKTELAKALADFLFNDESFLIRFDMSEFKEEHSAALLYGAPPGYVGYEQGGLLVNKIREKPYSVVLFDEIEKAHPSVFDIFLQILDEGKLHDRLGKEGDFTNAVVLFTSNIGSEFVVKQFGEGIIPAGNDLMEIMARHFRPEFLARLTEIVPFAPISEANVAKIFDIHLRGLTEPLRQQGIRLEISPAARDFLALSGFTPRYGARPLKGVIRSQLRRPVSRMIISGELNKGDTVQVGLTDGKELTWNVVSDTVAVEVV